MTMVRSAELLGQQRERQDGSIRRRRRNISFRQQPYNRLLLVLLLLLLLVLLLAQSVVVVLSFVPTTTRRTTIPYSQQQRNRLLLLSIQQQQQQQNDSYPTCRSNNNPIKLVSLSSSSLLFRNYNTKKKNNEVMRRNVLSQLFVSSSSSASSSTEIADGLVPIQFSNSNTNKDLTTIQSLLTRIGMITYIIAMCIALPVTLLPQKLAYKFNLLSRVQKEKLALSTGKFCARWLYRFIPFCSIECIRDKEDKDRDPSLNAKPPVPSIWVCNHISMLDVFILLAVDHKLRGYNTRPIKIVYWKTLESNPVTKLLFTMSGFIPVSMAPNAPGEDNQYDKKSFKALLKACKEAFTDGFDVAVLPEGQLNPTPENGLLPVFTGAYTLAKLSQRPIQMIGLYNIHNLWHPIKGIICSQRSIKLRCYTPSRYYSDPIDFKTSFETVIGYFGQYGIDLPNYQQYITGPITTSTTSSSANKKDDDSATTTTTTTTTAATSSTSPAPTIAEDTNTTEEDTTNGSNTNDYSI